MKRLNALWLMLPGGMLFGQTIDNANFSPVPGDAYTIHLGTYMNAGPAGTGQTWDFSDQQIEMSFSQSFVTPASTGHASSFPGANVAETTDGVNYGFYTTNANGFNLSGVYVDGAGVIFYSNSQLNVQYPCSYNTTWSDDYASNFTISGIPIQRTGTITGVADGTGSLVMPYGTVTNVLRVSLDDEMVDMIQGTPYPVNTTTHYWLKPGISTPLLTMSDQAGSQTARWASGDAVGIEEALRNAIGIDLFPNPAKDQVSVVFSSEGGRLQLELIDGLGRVVSAERVTPGAGIGRHDLDVSSLAPGLYHVRIQAENGQTGTKRLMVQ